MKICLAPTHLLWNESLGGHAWVFLNWALSLQEIGGEITLLEKMRWEDQPERLSKHLLAFRSRMANLGLRCGICLLHTEDQERQLAARGWELPALLTPLDQLQAEAELLINFRYALPREVIAGFRRSALVDIDPGLLQEWISAGQVRPAAHDIYFTIGETVGQPGALFPDCGLSWHHVPPPVFLPAWPHTPAAADAPYTTVTNWWGEYEVLGGEVVNNEKRTAFLPYLDLPSETAAPLELAVYHEPGHHSEMPMLVEKGWRARPAFEVSATPEDYRRYIQGSRGEFSCAKLSCMHLQNAWISDRTLCYLASGRPAVVQHTGPSRFLPDREGLLRFTSPAEAAQLLAEVESDHPRHARAARALAAEHFDGTRVLAALLAKAMGIPARRSSTGARP